VRAFLALALGLMVLLGAQGAWAAGFDAALAEEKAMKPIGGWQALGVRNLDGSDLPTRQLPAHIVIPDGPEGRAFMVYDNFRATLRWNRSNYFALAVGLLSDRIGGN
jgi:membrane-bound lytic murein transglycosylase B